LNAAIRSATRSTCASCKRISIHRFVQPTPLLVNWRNIPLHSESGDDAIPWHLRRWRWFSFFPLFGMLPR
jgi:hypothetical protein